jgi:alpha-L-fucosidase 2
MRFASVLKVHSTDGEIETVEEKSNAKINLTNATYVTLVFSGDTDYNINKLNFDSSINPFSVSKFKTDKVSKKSKNQIIKDHVKDHRNIFDRVDINLGKDSLSHLATDQRLALIQHNETKDPGLIELYYQYGRYLLMGSSRAPGKLPANLQGIWNDLFKAPWDADFHANINLQMNYWPAEITNLSETLIPLNNFLKQLTVPGSRTAKKMYNAKGWTMHHLTNPFGKTSVGDGVHGITPLNGAWMTFPLYRHYEFNQDLLYLKNEAYPIIRGSIEFVLDFLIESPDGYLVSNPSSSPENHFYIPGVEQRVELTYMPTVDKQIIEMLFDIFIESAETLKTDNFLVKKVKNAKKRLPPYQISKFGTLQEWIKDYEEEQPGHRHISHLLGVYPFGNLNNNNSIMFEAAKKSVARRLSFGGGHTGWSRAWIIGLYARFFDSVKAYDNLYDLLKKSTLKNLFDTHRPFQIDGNFGGTAAIHEMIIQSTKNDILLLPAIPIDWNDGYLYGSKVRGGAIVNLNWKDGKPERFEITSKKSGNFNIIFKEKQIPIKINAGQVLVLNKTDFY